jgi:hypothetical protein
MFSRLANFRTRRRSRAPIVIIGGDDAGAQWEPVTTAQGVSLGLAPAVRQQGQWQVVGQTPRRQANLADLVTLYQHFMAQMERRRPQAHFEVKARSTAVVRSVASGQ